MRARERGVVAGKRRVVDHPQAIGEDAHEGVGGVRRAVRDGDRLVSTHARAQNGARRDAGGLE